MHAFQNRLTYAATGCGRTTAYHTSGMRDEWTDGKHNCMTPLESGMHGDGTDGKTMHYENYPALCSRIEHRPNINQWLKI